MIGKEENQQNIDVLTMPNVESYILAQRVGNTVKKKTEYDLNVWMRFFRKISENREIEGMSADEFNILICRFIMDIKKKDGGAYEPTTLTSLASCLLSGKKMLFIGLGRSLLKETMPSVLKTSGTISSNTDI